MGGSDLFSMAGKRILVTGAAGHIGRLLCEYLLSDGAIVYATDVDRKGLDVLKSVGTNAQGSLQTFVADLSDEGERVELVRAVSESTRCLDGMVFAAAFVGTSGLEGWAVDFPEQSIASWRRALELNLTAPFHLTQLLHGLLSEGSNPSVVNLGSIYGRVGPDWALYEGLPMSNPAAYAASKGGLLQLTRWLAATLAPRIRVNIVSPGGIERGQSTKFRERYEQKIPLGRMAQEDDVVGQIVNCLSEASLYVTGQEIVVDGGYSTI